MKQVKQLAIVTAMAAIASLPIQVNASGDHGAHKPAAAAQASDMTDGEVRKVDAESGKITLKHSDIKSLDMPGMTMVFNVRDKTMLEKVKPGDKVKFTAEKIGGAFTVISIEPAK